MVVKEDDIRLFPGGSAEPSPQNGEPIALLQVYGDTSTVKVHRRDALALPKRVQFVPGSVPSATPDGLQLGALRHPSLRLRRPVPLKVSRENEHVSVWSDEFDEIGYGPHLTAAVEDLQQTVAELYFSLKVDQDRLGPEMLRLWETLQELVEERP